MPHSRPAYHLTYMALLIFSHHASASDQFKAGEYIRDTELTPGWLTITSTSPSRLKFHLVTELRVTGDDGALTHNGAIEESEAVISGANAVYRSSYEEDKELGTCQLNLRQNQQKIIATQSGKCWWFGVGIDASGTYQKHEFSPELRASILREVNHEH